MKKLQLKALAVIFASSALVGGASTAQAGSGPQAYVTTPDGVVVRVNDREGRCVRTTSWSKELATKECDPELFPDPVPVAVAAAPTYEAMTLSANALFGFDSDDLTTEGKAALQAMGDKIRAKGAQLVDIDIIGHTDSSGPEEYNQQLSVRRATAIKSYIVSEKDIDASIIDVSGKGESAPIADNATAEGRAQNRRVEINVGVKAPN